jgi:hypothetical protein
MRGFSCWSISLNLATTMLVLALGVTTGQADSLADGPYLSWVCANEGDPVWGDSGPPPMYWESMYQQYTPTGACSICDLDPVNPFCASTDFMDRAWDGVHFWAELYLANNVEPAVPRQVDVELWSATDQNLGMLLATATAMVSNAMPAQRYVFDLGTPVYASGPMRLQLRIVYYGPLGDTHVYWNGLTCPTGLYCDMPIGVTPQTWGGVKSLYDK